MQERCEMIKNWESEKLQDCIEKIVYTNKVERKKFLSCGKYPVVSQEKDFINGYWDNDYDLFKIDIPVVVFGDHTKVLKFIDFNFIIGADGVKILKPKRNIDSKYLYYFLCSIDLEDLGYARHYRLLKDTLICFPRKLEEQRRIVAILDEAFAGISAAKESAEQNLKNAKEVFEAYLKQILSPKEDWIIKKMSECFKLKSGEGLTSKEMSSEGIYPVYGGNGVSGMYNNFNLSGSNIIIGRVGSLCGNVRHVKEKIWLTDNAFKVVTCKVKFDFDFLCYLLSSKKLRSYARQAAQPVISNSSLSEVLLEFPYSVDKQKVIVSQLDSLSGETSRLESIYQQKLANLEELKKSILHKAFSGAL